MNRIMAGFTFSAVLAVAACGGAAPTEDGPIAPAVVGDTARVDLAVGQSTRIGDLTIGFDRVTEDSRCPSDVVCVWEGNARVVLTVNGDGPARSLDLNTALRPQEVVIDGYKASIESLTPYPRSNATAEPNDYVVRLRLVAAG